MTTTHKHTILLGALLAAATTAQAQDTYLNAAVSTQDLDGTARYVGMGGAMEALGADLSTIGSNPAGIGLFRSSQAKVSFGFVSQEGAKDFNSANKTNMSFDQAGFVYSMRTGRRHFINFAFNYHKSSNFNHILSAAGSLNGDASQNKLTYLKATNDLFALPMEGKGDIWGEDNLFDRTSNLYNAADYLNTNAIMAEWDDQDNITYYYNGASGYDMKRAHSGYIGSYDFNISGNANDRFYWGLTFGIHDVHYNAYSQYTEGLVSSEGTGVGDVTVTDDRTITGTGFDVKAGVIVRPVEESPFRIGLSVASPTFYDLESSYSTRLDNHAKVGAYNYVSNSDRYDFRLNTPWKFGLSAGTTISNVAAVGVSYEYADYASLDTRVKDSEYDSWADDFYETSSSDHEMNSATKRTLKGVHTLKLGAELKPTDDLAVRVGYNYVSPMYKDGATRGTDVDCTSNAYTSTTDYTNWESTNRITCGLGYTVERFTVDLAYQYSTQSGKFRPFDNYLGQNYSDAVKVKNDRHQLLLTLGYKF